ncbi:MAG: helix-turn-helix domain-containing protein [Candidatus Helarchaeota archaeon]
MGRRRALSKEKMKDLKFILSLGECISAQQLAFKFRVSKATLYRYIKLLNVEIHSKTKSRGK